MKPKDKDKNYLQEFEERQAAAEKFLKQVLVPVYKQAQLRLPGVHTADLIDPLLEEYQAAQGLQFRRSDIPLAASNLKIKEKEGDITLDFIQRDVEVLEDEHTMAEKGRGSKYGISDESRIADLKYELNQLRKKRMHIRTKDGQDWLSANSVENKLSQKE